MQRSVLAGTFGGNPAAALQCTELATLAGEVELRYQRAQAAAKTLIAAAGPEQAQLALETVSTVMQVGSNIS